LSRRSALERLPNCAPSGSLWAVRRRLSAGVKAIGGGGVAGECAPSVSASGGELEPRSGRGRRHSLAAGGETRGSQKRKHSARGEALRAHCAPRVRQAQCAPLESVCGRANLARLLRWLAAGPCGAHCKRAGRRVSKPAGKQVVAPSKLAAFELVSISVVCTLDQLREQRRDSSRSKPRAVDQQGQLAPPPAVIRALFGESCNLLESS